MQNTFHTDAPVTKHNLLLALTDAVTNDRRVRLSVDSNGNLKVKVGEGMWSAPIRSTIDPYRA